MVSEAGTLAVAAEPKRVQLERLLRERAGRQRHFPLSFAQQRLWLIEQIEPGSSAYHVTATLRLRGALDPRVFAAALREIVRRHQTLRTTFALVDEEPVQVVSPAARVSVTLVDCMDLQRERREEEARRAGLAASRIPFDLGTGPLLRIFLLRLDDDDFLLFAAMHHIISDGWSLGVLVSELGVLYRAFAAGRSSSLPPLPLQYVDFAQWQRQRLAGERLAMLIDWWRERLQGAPALLELPTDRPRPAMQSFRGASVSFALSRELGERLIALARSAGKTLFMILLAAFQALLSRYSRQEDLCVGTPIAGRGREELEGLIGFFVNTLVLRTDLAGDPTVRELLERAGEAALGAYEHQEIPFEKLVEALQPARDPSHTPLFQVELILQNTPEASWELPDLQLTPLTADRDTAKFDLQLEMFDGPLGLRGVLEYNRDLFDRTTAARLARHFERLLAGMIADPDLGISRLPWLSEAERHQLLAEWNRAAPVPSVSYTLHGAFEKRVRERPNAVAATCEDASLTYRELNARANRLARHLRRLGVGPESRVAVCLERSLDMVVAILSVLKAGGAYVPIDPVYPRERKSLLLAESAAAALITEVGLRTDFTSEGAPVVLVDSGTPGRASRRAGERESDLVPLTYPEGLAYVIYTSGSTGRPKGVLVPHAHVGRLFTATDPWFHFGPDDVWTLFHSYAFDFSVWEIWGALLYGGRLVIVPYWVSRSPEDFRDLLARERVTVLNQTPSAFRQLIAADGARASEIHLRWVIFGGEALDLQSLRPWLDRYGDDHPRLVNMYGITETTVHVTYRPIAAGDLATPGSPIGAAIPDLDLRILDRAFEAIPIGVPGELCVGGAGPARGYLGRPELTAERFVPDPFATAPGARLYRSGDLARYRPHGDLEHLGRIDHQVKIRGFRIELGEIESVLTAHPGVRAAVVAARKDGNGDGCLVAYVVPADPDVTAAGLRDFVRAKQPEPLVPAAFVLLERLPLTPHGKVDRAALPAPDFAAGAEAYVAPRTRAEAALAGIWADLLKVERVGMSDNFFDLGGDSIKAVRLISRMNEIPGVDLRVQDVFKHQSIGALAAHLAGSRDAGSLAEERAEGLARIAALQRSVLADEEQRRLLPEGWEDFFPLSSIERGMIYYSLLLPDQPIYHDQYAYVLSIPDLTAFFDAFDALVARHPVLRSTFHLYDFVEPMKVVHPAFRTAREVEDLAGLPEGEKSRRMASYRADDLDDKFDFHGGRLWRLKLFRLDGDTLCAIWSCHHAIIDGWSNVTFWVELNEILSRPADDSPLPPLASSYKDYLAITLARHRSPQTEVFWRQQLAGLSRNKLPFNRTVGTDRTAYGMSSTDRLLGSNLLTALRTQARQLNAPLQAVCLAAHVYLLRVIAAEEDVVTGVVTNDRPGIVDGDKIVGCFLNTVPIRLRVAPGETGASLIRRVSGFLAAEKEHEIPLVDIAALVGFREAATNPIFDTLFNFLDFHLVEGVKENVLFRGARSSAAIVDLRNSEMTNTLFDLEIGTTLGNFKAHLKYSPRHFETVDIERALDLYQRILSCLSRDPNAPLAAEALLTGSERTELVHGYNDTAREYPRARPLHGFFEERAALDPEGLAVVVAGAALTYGELDRRANRLAHLLQARGVRPGDNVGVCYERSPELAVALLAVLKAAAAYVPLEPAYPPLRKGYILLQSAVSLLLTDRPYALPVEIAIEQLVPTELAACSAAPLALRPRPEDLAYTIYTSGSTGTPKGVMIEHHSAANLISWVNREFAVGPGDRVLMVSSVCFDLSVYDLFGALGAGATVVLARQEEVQDPAALKRLVVEQGITFWNSVPSTLGLLVQYLEDAEPELRDETLRVAFLSGDWIPLSLPGRARRFFPALRLISLGGATEATVWSIFHPIERIDPARASIPYGRPLDNNAFYVLDRSLELVPPGVVGDLYIGGVGVARGYAGDAEKTAVSFRPDPFSPVGGARLYRTGDLGRMLPLPERRMEIEFLGRDDHQVKIRGFRVELGEIESQLARHPGVREAVVAARADRAGQKYLCAYVVPVAAVATGELQRHLATTLPGYMVPDTFVVLAELPLTANGKIDRQALPDPEAAALAEGEGYAVPAGEVETALAAIWQEVLGVDRIGAQHDFFALGGHSLSAIQVLTRIRSRFAVELPLPDFFAQPTLTGMAAAIERLRAGGGSAAPPLVRRSRPERLPLSFAQERLWFLDRLLPGNTAYNIPLALGLKGRLARPALVASLNEVAARHEVLRTTFALADGRPVQIIAPTPQLDPAFIDLSGLPEELRKSEAKSLGREEASRPFDLERGPLVRSTLLRLAEEHHTAIFTLHHIVADGWSMGALVREVGELYRALSRGARASLPELPVQYADFALWQREWLSGEVLDEQIAFWRRSLEGAPALLELPTDRPRPAGQSYRGAKVPFSFGADLAAGLAELRRSHGVTLFQALLAAFQALLARLTGQPDVVVGSPVAGRNRLETENLIGFFVNTLALRTSAEDNPSFGEFLALVRAGTIQAYANEDLPFEKLVEELRPERSLDHSPIFQVMLVLQNAPMSPLNLPDLTLEPVPVEEGSTKFDLTVSVLEASNRLLGSWEYASDLFDATTILRFQACFETLLRGAMANPAQLLWELPLLGPAERHQAMIDWNDTDVPPRGRLVHEVFEEWAACAPEVVAVVSPQEEALSYGELNRRANQLAYYLRRHGLGADARVGICVERSLDMVVGILAVLKAGGAYVPLDPGYPGERLAFMLEDSHAAVLLTQERLLDRLPDTGVQVVLLDRDRPAMEIQSPENPAACETRRKAQDAVYMIYTSGSTGRPKGVTVTHEILVNLLLWQEESTGLASSARTLQFASLSFDVSCQEIFSTWFGGGTLYLIAEETRRDAVALLALLARARIERLYLPFVALRQLAEAAELRKDPAPDLCLRHLITAGEQLQATPAIRRWLASLPGCRLHNQYGPSESHVVTAATLSGNAFTWPTLPTIGRPIARTRIYLANRRFELVPPGVAGELCVGGIAFGAGYLGRPELTAERFTPDPWSGTPGGRLYCTGDLARHHVDGEIEYLRRIDQQVKIRGFRIEPGEVEAAMTAVPGVRAAVVVVHENLPGGRGLVAHVIPQPGAALTTERLRESLQARLPDYMIPSHFAFPDALPLTPSGKVDRKILKELALELAPNQSSLEPRSPVEEMLAGIWAELLRLDRVGIDDDFFALGGHSLLATQAVSRVHSILGVTLPLRWLFEQPTVRGFAGLIGPALAGTRLMGAEMEAPPILPLPWDDNPPLSFAQQRFWFLHGLDPANPWYNMSAALRIMGELDVRSFARSVTEIVSRHASLRTIFPAVDGQPVQKIGPAPDLEAGFPLPMLDLTALSPGRVGTELEKQLQEAATAPFDLEHGPLLRASLVRTGEREHALILVVHHIVSDGWSVGIFVRELSILYRAFRQGEASPLPDLPIQYADYAAWQRSWLSGETLERLIAAWRRRLAGAPAALELPIDHPRPPVQSLRGGTVPIWLGKEVSSALHALSQQAGTTLFMTLLGAFQVLLHRYSGQDDVVVGTPVAGRNRREIEGLIGLFLNTLALRGDLSGDPPLRNLLGRVREAALEAYTLQDLPFEKLVEELKPVRDYSRPPIFQVMLTLQNAPAGELALPGLGLSPLPVKSGTAKFELLVSITESTQGLSGFLEYNADLFDRATAEHMARHLSEVLASAAADPDLQVSRLRLLSSEERDQILRASGASRTFPVDRCLHETFADRAVLTPETIAVSCKGESLTYGELDSRANQVAHYLRRLGVGPEDIVGLCLDRSIELVVGLLGILKASGAFLPLDPAYPSERLAFMLEDAGARVLVTSEPHIARLALPMNGSRTRNVVRLDADRDAIARESTNGPAGGAGPENLAYIIYTSGSTGRPKGSLIPHSRVLRLFSATQEWFGFDGRDVWTLFHSFAFDFSVWEMWGALLYGGRLVIVPYGVSRSPGDFHELLVRERVTVLNQTPSAFRLLVRTAEEKGDTLRELRLRLVIFGGDALSPSSFSSWLAPEKERGEELAVRLVNMYGITETTVHVTYRPLTIADAARPQSPIGRPLPDLSLFLVDHHLEPVPVGVPGELVVGGAGLARGYLGRPDLTAARFVPDPFGESGTRLYRSGDLARRLANNDVEYLGRIDHQVKLRGFRIELGEIEEEIRRHPAVDQAVVLAVGSNEDHKLVAYVAPANGVAPELAELRSFLLARIPEYMVPAGWMFLPSIPLTANGKVDRKALPTPERTGVAATVYEQPRTGLEQVIAEIWRELLGIDRVGVHDNFFDLGGHSLLMARVQSRLQEQLGRKVSMVDLLSHANIESLAHFLTRSEGSDPHSAEAAQATRLVDRTREGKARLRRMRLSREPLPEEGF